MLIVPAYAQIDILYVALSLTFVINLCFSDRFWLLKCCVDVLTHTLSI